MIRNEVRELLRLARLDLGSAQTVYDCAPACFFSQQAGEKYLKAFLAFHGVTYERTHDLSRLLSLCKRITPDFSELQEDARILAPYAVEVRYREATAATATQMWRATAEASWRIHAFVMARLPADYAEHDSAPT